MRAYGQQQRIERAGRVAGDSDVAGVAAEGGDVRLYPFQRGELVQQRIVARRVVRAFFPQRVETQEAPNAQPVLHLDQDDAFAVQGGFQRSSPVGAAA